MWVVKRKWPRRCSNTPGPGPQKGHAPVDTAKIHREQDKDHHPHACYEGVVYMTYTVHDEAVGAEVERIEAIPCRRCTEEAR
jgi:hypothetical protein